jgi:hypothetical protein
MSLVLINNGIVDTSSVSKEELKTLIKNKLVVRHKGKYCLKEHLERMNKK